MYLLESVVISNGPALWTGQQDDSTSYVCDAVFTHVCLTSLDELRSRLASATESLGIVDCRGRSSVTHITVHCASQSTHGLIAVTFTVALRHGSHSLTCNYTDACLYLVSDHQMAPPQT